MTVEVLSEWAAAQNWGFAFFAACFFFNVHLLQKKELIPAMWASLFHPNYRPDFTSFAINTDFVDKLLMCLQTVISFAIFIYYPLTNTVDLQNETLSHLFGLIVLTAGVLILFVLYKFLSNFLIGNIFFPKESVQIWNDSLFSALALSGWVLFIPAVLFFYAKETYTFCFYFVLIYLILVVLWTVFKIYTIFFGRKAYLLHFILYLCAQEIVPLYLLYKALVYVFFANQKGVL